MLRLAFPVMVLLASCGLISSDVTDFKLRFPRHDFRVDSDDWDLQGTGAAPAVPCAPDCSGLQTAVCGSDVDCNMSLTSTCDGAAPTPMCQANITLSLANNFDLANEAPEYAEIASRPVVSVTIDDIWFQITENTLNIDTPELRVHIGPQTLTGPNDPNARLVGTIRAIPHGQTGKWIVDFGTDGRTALKAHMDDFHTPFRIIVSGTLVVRAGQALPTGRLIGYVQADARAGL